MKKMLLVLVMLVGTAAIVCGEKIEFRGRVGMVRQFGNRTIIYVNGQKPVSIDGTRSQLYQWA